MKCCAQKLVSFPDHFSLHRENVLVNGLFYSCFTCQFVGRPIRLRCVSEVIHRNNGDQESWVIEAVCRRLVSEPDPSLRRKGLGTCVHPNCPQDGMLTWPIRIVDCKLRHGNGFSSGFQCRQRLDMANCCVVLCFTRVLDESWGEQRADQQWTRQWCRHKSLITMHNYIL